MKRVLSLFLAALLLIGGISTPMVYAESAASLFIDNKVVELNSEIIVENGNVLLPLREVSEKLGYKVKWNSKDWTVELTENENMSKIKINSQDVESKEGKSVLKVAPILREAKTYVPAEFFANNLGKIVAWDSQTQKIAINNIRENSEDFFKKSNDLEMIKNLEKFMDEYTERQSFQGAVLVAKDNEVLLNKGYGLSDKELNIKAKSQTKYGIGSMTKQFTATAVMKLLEDGKINVEDKVSKYIDGLKYGDKINIHQLLTHQSGLVNVTDLPEFYTLKGESPQEAINLVKDKELLAEPGTEFAYNNTNYILLGMIVEKVTGQSLENYSHKNFFEPTNMKDTGMSYGKKEGFHIATPYAGYIDVLKSDDKPLLENAYGAGNIYSTVEDMYRWSKAIDGEAILKKATKEKMFKPEAKMTDKKSYGYGWMVGENEDGVYYEHDGATLGFMSVIYKNISKDITVVVLANKRMTSVYDIAYGLERVVLGKEVDFDKVAKAQPKAIKLSNEELDKYVGVYTGLDPMTNTDTGRFEITREANKLYLKYQDQEKMEILPMGDNKFFSKLLEFDLVFENIENGKANKLSFAQMGILFKANREGVVENKVEVSEDILKKYLGTYNLAEGFDLTITLKEGKLFAQATGQDAFSLSPLSETKFEYDAIAANMEFELNEDGTVKQLNFHQGDVNLTGIKKK